LFFSWLSFPISFVVFRDDAVTKTAIGVLGDLADTLGNNAGPLINQSVSCKEFLEECLSSDDRLIKESADWAKLAVSRAISGWCSSYAGIVGESAFIWVASSRVKGLGLHLSMCRSVRCHHFLHKVLSGGVRMMGLSLTFVSACWSQSGSLCFLTKRSGSVLAFTSTNLQENWKWLLAFKKRPVGVHISLYGLSHGLLIHLKHHPVLLAYASHWWSLNYHFRAGQQLEGWLFRITDIQKQHRTWDFPPGIFIQVSLSPIIQVWSMLLATPCNFFPLFL